MSLVIHETQTIYSAPSSFGFVGDLLGFGEPERIGYVTRMLVDQRFQGDPNAQARLNQQWVPQSKDDRLSQWMLYNMQPAPTPLEWLISSEVARMGGRAFSAELGKRISEARARSTILASA